MRNNYLLSIFLICLLLSSANLQAQDKQAQEEKRKKEKFEKMGTKGYDMAKLSKFTENLKKELKANKEKAFKLAKEKGWSREFVTENGSIAYLQGVDDYGNPIYYSTFNNTTAAEATQTNVLNSTSNNNPYQLYGDNLTVRVWDGGRANVDHQEFDGLGGDNRVSFHDTFTFAQYGLDGNNHANHVIGTIAASGFEARAKGMAPRANIKAYDLIDDLTEMTDEIGRGMILSNHSYGRPPRDENGDIWQDYTYGKYNSTSRSVDAIMYNAPNYLMVVAAGNSGTDNSNGAPLLTGFDKLSQFQVAKNTLVVANASSVQRDANGNLTSATIFEGSSQGPTDDYRIKPDITGYGTNVYSATYNSNNFLDFNRNDDYTTMTGTSMASPNVTGSLLLLQEYYNREIDSLNFMKAASLKGLALHTAEDAGLNGPDAIFGWGIFNAKKSADLIKRTKGLPIIDSLRRDTIVISTIGENNSVVHDTITDLISIPRNNFSRLDQLTLANRDTLRFKVYSENKKLLASLSWTDVEGTVPNNIVNSNVRVLVNDLDLRVQKLGTQTVNEDTLTIVRNTFLPYELSGVLSNARRDNNVDPFERINVKESIIGQNDEVGAEYLITITHKGTLNNSNNQNFSLILSGIGRSCENETLETPTEISATNITFNSAMVSWTPVEEGSSLLFTVRYKEKAGDEDSWIELPSTIWHNEAIKIKDLLPETTYEIQIKATCGENSTEFGNSQEFTTGQGLEESELIAENITKSSIKLTWAPFTNAQGPVKYSLYRVTDDNNKVLVGETQLTNIDVLNLNSSTTYNYYLEAIDSIGNSGRTPVASFTTLEGITVPSNFAVDSVQNTTVSLSWDASTNSSGTILYTIYKVINGIETLEASTQNTQLSVDNLPALTEVTFHITATDLSDNDTSSRASVIANTLESLELEAPSNLRVNGINASQFTLRWNAPTNNVGSLTYRIYYKRLGGTYSLLRSDNSPYPIISTSNLSFIIPGYSLNTTYFFKIEARDNNTQRTSLSDEYGVRITRNWFTGVYSNSYLNPGLLGDNPNDDVIGGMISGTSIYPNPVKDFINIKSQEEYTKYKIVDLLGREVLNGRLIDFSAINASSLKSGIYILMLSNESKNITIKFIKE